MTARETSDRHEERWANVHPDFDGHLSKSIADMSYSERLAWIEEGMWLLHWRDTQVKRLSKEEQ